MLMLILFQALKHLMYYFFSVVIIYWHAIRETDSEKQFTKG